MQTLVNLANGKLRTHVDLVIDFRFETNVGRLAILGHHENRCLDGRERRQDEIEEDIRIRIKRFLAWP